MAELTARKENEWSDRDEVQTALVIVCPAGWVHDRGGGLHWSSDSSLFLVLSLSALNSQPSTCTNA
jgi:hypothetical protein